MEIKIAKLTFKRNHTRRQRTTNITVHHSASAANKTVYDIQGWHLANGWYGIGYHFVIHANGDIYGGRPIWAVGAHAYQDQQHEANSNGIGICLVGDFMTGEPTIEQFNSLVWLIQYIRQQYPGLIVQRHSDVLPTACPGKNFPWALLVKRLEGVTVSDWKDEAIKKAEAAGIIMPNIHKSSEPADKGFVVAVANNLLAKIKEDL